MDRVVLEALQDLPYALLAPARQDVLERLEPLAHLHVVQFGALVVGELGAIVRQDLV